MLLKTGAINALLAYELLKICQKEPDEIKSQLFKMIDNKFGLTGNTSQEKFKDLKYGLELYFYYIHKKRIFHGKPLTCRNTTLGNYVKQTQRNIRN